MSGEIIKFQSLSSAVDVSFWQELGKRKINVYQLSDAAVPVFASYTVSTSKNPVGRMSMAGDTSFEEQRRDWNLNHIPSTGTLKNTNTIEEFQALNKNAIITDCGDRIFQAISDGRAVKNPQLLNQFLLVTFADIKTHKFYYWFGFPAIVPSSLSFSYAVFPSFYASAPRDKGTLAIREAFSDGEIHQLLDAWSAFAAKKQGYFVVRVERSSKGEEEKEKTARITLHRIDEYLQLIGIAGENRPSVELLLGFLDPCHLEEAPGWPLRNFLLLAATALNVSSTRVLCFRDVAAAVSRQNATSSSSTTSALADVTYGSIVLSIDMKSTVAPTVPSTASSASATESSSSSSPCSYKVTGWEANARGNMGPRLVDLSSFLDDKMMAASTADLNLKLMRWRMLPQLDLDGMATLKVRVPCLSFFPFRFPFIMLIFLISLFASHQGPVARFGYPRLQRRACTPGLGIPELYVCR